MAILLVLVHQLDEVARTPGASFVEAVVRHFLAFGWVGVQLFFVLSGFLITGILCDARGKRDYYHSFYIRRILRIFPLYYGALCVFVLLLPALGLAPTDWQKDQLPLWAFMSNWMGTGAMPHFWSLAVEEQFYLVWPLVVIRLQDRGLFVACVGLAALSLASRILMVAMGVEPGLIYSSSISRMDALALGAAAAAALRLPDSALPLPHSPRTLWTVAWVVALLGLVTTHFYAVKSPLGQTLGYSALSIAFSCAVLALARGDSSLPAAPRPATAFLRSRAIRAVGTYSFGMYVFHKPLHDLVGRRVLERLGLRESLPLGPGITYIAIGIVVTFLAGFLSYHWYERHFLELKDRLAPRPA